MEKHCSCTFEETGGCLSSSSNSVKVSVIIPTFNAEKYIERLLNRLLAQTVDAEILLIDSESRDQTVSIIEQIIDSVSASKSDQIRLLQISKDEFDHGGTRDFALRLTTGEYVMFLTQDALPKDRHCIENLLKAFSEADIAGVYGRQIAYPDALPYERLTREFNYPVRARIWREKDISQYGVKSYFFSNTCSMYRRDFYEAVGGFDAPIITNEDMMMAAKLLHSGYALAYAPDACVFHSHRNTLLEDYRRNMRIGYVMHQYRERLTGAKADSEGMRLVRYVGKGLVQEKHFLSFGTFCIHAAARLVGNRVGKAKRRREEQFRV